MRYALPLFLALLAGCGEKPTTVEDLNTVQITLPHGQVIKVEMMISDMDRLRGLMFRNSLAPDHGMLFIHQRPGKYTYWMYQTLIPLDMMWMDSGHKIVEMVENAPPCKTNSSQCAHFGGNQVAQFVLQLGGGMAKKYQLELGQTIQW